MRVVVPAVIIIIVRPSSVRRPYHLCIGLNGCPCCVSSGHTRPQLAARTNGCSAGHRSSHTNFHTTKRRPRTAQRTDELIAWAREAWKGTPDLVAGILHTGAEAVEAALKTAIAATGRSTIVAFEGAYHGSFGVAAGVTASGGARDAFEPAVSFEDVRRERYGSVPLLDESVACVIAEPVQGNTGVQIPGAEWLDELREECHRVGALLILDDVLVGAGRTGNRLEGAECGPDIVTLAKALGGGVMCSAVIARSDIAEAAWEGDDAPSISTTYYGHPLSCAAILEVLQLHEQRDVLDLAGHVEAVIRAAARDAALEVRGRGAFCALDTGEKRGGERLADALLERSVIVTVSGEQSEAVNLTPSLLMQDESFDWIHEAIVAAAETVAAQPGGAR